MPDPALPVYRERLWPSPWVYLATALVIPASLLVFLPISMTAGVVAATALYAAILVVLVATTPEVRLDEAQLRAGRASIPLSLVAGATAHEGEDAVAERGTRLDARAWLLLRGWIPGLVRIELADPEDPTPYWLVSTRRPAQLAAAITRAAARA